MKRASLLLAAAAIAIAPAYAQSSVVSEQVRLDDSFAALNLHVDEADDVSGAAVAGANSFTATANGAGIDAYATQYSEGSATAAADATVWRAWGDVAVGAAATGNGVVGAVENGALNVEGWQIQHGDTAASARVRTGTTWSGATSASAGANVTDVSAYNGDLRLVTGQTNTGSVSANVEADHCCVSTDIEAGAVASANSASAAGYTTTMLTATEQTSTGEAVRARTDLWAGYAGSASGSAVANGNTFSAANQWGYVNVAARQANSAGVIAESYVTLGGDWLSFASAGAYGVGNSAAVSNVGSDTVMATAQDNMGFVGAYAALAGNGGDAAVSSTAYGNVVTGGLCNGCENGSLTASNTQTNSGRVESVTTVRSGWAGSVAGSATAIGNAASYSVSN